MCIKEAQDNYNKRMKVRKSRAKHLLGEMRAIAFNKKNELKPTIRRSGNITCGYFISPTTKTPKRTSQLNFERG